MKIILTRRYTKDNSQNIFGDYKGLQVRLHYSLDKSAKGYHRTGRSFWLVGKLNKGGVRVRDKRVTKKVFQDLLYNFFLQQRGTRISTP